MDLGTLNLIRNLGEAQPVCLSAEQRSLADFVPSIQYHSSEADHAVESEQVHDVIEDEHLNPILSAFDLPISSAPVAGMLIERVEHGSHQITGILR